MKVVCGPPEKHWYTESVTCHTGKLGKNNVTYVKGYIYKIRDKLEKLSLISHSDIRYNMT